jgi:putative SbcD/Mre11-related phosphoesterase
MPDAPVPSAVADCGLRDRALRLGDALIVADLHLGQGATSGLEVPVGNGTAMIERLRDLLAWAEPAELVLAGDLLHSFSTVPMAVTDAVEAIADAAREAGAEPVALRGNHDTMLEGVWDGPVRDSHRLGDTVVVHGHETPAVDAERYVIGHEHPMLEVAGRRRPCYLAAADAFEGADVIVLPAFSRLLRGVVINRASAADFMSPLVTNADAFAPVVWDEDARETLPFPPLGQLRDRL